MKKTIIASFAALFLAAGANAQTAAKEAAPAKPQTGVAEKKEAPKTTAAPVAAPMKAESKEAAKPAAEKAKEAKHEDHKGEKHEKK
jgi:hypothetical protein